MLPRSPLPAHLATARFRLDALRPADAGALFAHFADAEVTRYLDIDPLTELAQAHEIIAWANRLAETDAGGRWAIRSRDGDTWIGTVGFNAINRERASRAEVAYDLARAWRGQGVMSEVLPVLIRTGFVDLELNRLEAFVTPGNDRSGRLLSRHGFLREGLLRQYGRWRGRDWDQELWALLRDDWHEPAG